MVGWNHYEPIIVKMIQYQQGPHGKLFIIQFGCKCGKINKKYGYPISSYIMHMKNKSSKMTGNMIENPLSPLLHLLKSTCKNPGTNKFWN
jgi:hypothetical protein